MNYYPRHLGDYARSAGYLSTLEHGAYTLLLDWYYANETPIRKEDAYSICKASSRTEKQAVHKVLQTFFIWIDSKVWCHKRVEAELSEMREKSAKRRSAANQRWHPEGMHMHNKSNTNEMLSNSQHPITKIQTQKINHRKC